MRKLFTTLLAVAAIAGTAKAGDVIYQTDFSTLEEFGQWTVINANDDDKTWEWNAEGDPGKVFYSYHSTNTGDDWLISPEITPPAGETLMVKFTYKGSYYGENLEVWHGKGASVEAMTTKDIALEGLNGDVASKFFFIQVGAGESFNLGFHATSNPDT